MTTRNQLVPQPKITHWKTVIIVGWNEVIMVGRGDNVDAGRQPVLFKDLHRFETRLTESVIETKRDYVCLLPLDRCSKCRQSHTLKKAPTGDGIQTHGYFAVRFRNSINCFSRAKVSAYMGASTKLLISIGSTS